MAQSGCMSHTSSRLLQVTLRYRLCCRSNQLGHHATFKQTHAAATFSPCLDSNHFLEPFLGSNPKRHMVDAESWELKCGRDSPERVIGSLPDACLFFPGKLSTRNCIKMSVLWASYFFLLVCSSGLRFGRSNRCDEVRKVFQLRQIGPNQLLPLSPRPGMLLLNLLIE